MAGLKKRRNAGFLLIELATAIVLLSFFFFIASAWYGQASRERARGLKHFCALRAAYNVIERCRHDKNLLKSGSWQEDEVQLTWSLAPVRGVPRFQLMRMKVGCQDEHFELTTGICV